jgi:hypothetical protein
MGRDMANRSVFGVFGFFLLLLDTGTRVVFLCSAFQPFLTRHILGNPTQARRSARGSDARIGDLSSGVAGEEDGGWRTEIGHFKAGFLVSIFRQCEMQIHIYTRDNQNGCSLNY